MPDAQIESKWIKKAKDVLRQVEQLFPTSRV